MRHDDLGGQQVGVFDVVDGLACRFDAKLIGIDVHGCQRRVGDAGEQRVVEGYDGQIFRDAQAQLAAELFQYYRKNVIADQNRCRAVRSGKQCFQGGFIGIIQGIDLHAVPFVHILKLIRSRMGGSGWILAELLVVFVVIWFMTSYFLMMGKSWYEPVGYDLEGVYHAVLAVRPSNSPSFVTYEEGGDEAARDVERIVERLRGHADVEAVALSVSSLPYTLSWSGSRVTRDSVSVSVRLMTVSPDYFRVFGIRPASGESPERLGEALSGTREGRDRVISAELARRLYGTTDAIGADIYLHGDTLPGHVVAVTGPVRNDEFDRRKQCILFSLLDLRELNDLTQVQITFRLRPSVATAGYADRFLKAMKRQLMVGNFWVSEVRAYPDVRSSYLENSIESNAQRIVSALGLFLLTNVFLAVIGTFWFHVSRRRAELGLRMAMGSTRASILGLVMGEGLMLLTIATVPALLICVNLAWIDLMPPGLVESKVGCFLINSLLTWLILALIISLATWYPARKASSLEPADALRYDG